MKGASYPPRRKQYVGEVGWKIDDKFHNQVNEKVIRSGNQIQLKMFRKSLEENSAAILTSTGPLSSTNRGVSGYPPGMPLHESLGVSLEQTGADMPATPAVSVTSSRVSTDE